MSKKGYSLTEKQTRFAKNNIGLIFEFMKKRKLDERDYFDRLTPAYIDAVAEYCSNTNLQMEFDFEEFAYTALRTALATLTRKTPATPNKRIVNSFESMLFQLGGPGSFENEYAEDPAEQFARHEVVEAILQLITEKERDVLMMRADDGFSVVEIASQCGLTPNGVRSRFYRMRQRILSNVTLADLL